LGQDVGSTIGTYAIFVFSSVKLNKDIFFNAWASGGVVFGGEHCDLWQRDKRAQNGKTMRLFTGGAIRAQPRVAVLPELDSSGDGLRV
jgi:hypothetical protein